MATEKQRAAARQNIKKAQARWREMSPQQRARTQPQGRSRQKPGSTGKGSYYHVAIRPKTDFVTFRTQDVGEPGHVQRVAGKRSSGSWATVAWLISKEDAHVTKGELRPNTPGAREVLNKLGAKPVQVKGDRFEAKPRPNVPEESKPTSAQSRAQHSNIKKAQAARHKK